MATTQQNGWDSFVSLDWYDSTISFLFRFVAKTSEPLLAAGVIVSAADFLQKGQLLAHNPTLASTWAWCQALALEASTGPCLVFALQALRDRDRVKGVLYAILASLLFIVGSSMLMLQLMSSVIGTNEASIWLPILIALFALRVIVSGGMIGLSCTKSMRFSGWVSQIETPDRASDRRAITCAIRPLQAARLRPLSSRWIAVQRITIVDESVLSLPEHASAIADRSEPITSITTNEQTNVGDQIREVLSASPHLSNREIAAQVGCSPSTVSTWRRKEATRE